jgi:large exoprotein involved in heme utilization and adhesion
MGARVLKAKTITLGFVLAVVVTATLVSGCTNDEPGTTEGASAGTAPTIADTTTSEGATTTSLATTPTEPARRPITDEEIRTLAPSYSAFTPDEIQVVDFETFGDWAVAHVTAEDADTALVIFTRETAGWTVLDIGTGLGPEDLRTEGVPEDVVEWAFPSNP